MQTRLKSLTSLSLIFCLLLSATSQTVSLDPSVISSEISVNTVSSQCQQDLNYLKELLQRIEGDIKRGSINDLINDIYYLVEELPQLYNDCFTNNQSQAVLDLFTSSLTSAVSRHCDAQTTQNTNTFILGLAASLIESSSVSSEIKGQMEAVVNGLRPCIRSKRVVKQNGRALQQELSQACKQDIAWLKEILARIKGDIERGSINDAVNDIYYLIEQLPQIYNDCVGAGPSQAKDVKNLISLNFSDIIEKYCNPSKSMKAEASLKRILSFLSNKLEVTPELIIEAGTFVTGLKECMVVS